jgi:hypothetical protein
MRALSAAWVLKLWVQRLVFMVVSGVQHIFELVYQVIRVVHVFLMNRVKVAVVYGWEEFVRSQMLSCCGAALWRLTSRIFFLFIARIGLVFILSLSWLITNSTWMWLDSKKFGLVSHTSILGAK